MKKCDLEKNVASLLLASCVSTFLLLGVAARVSAQCQRSFNSPYGVCVHLPRGQDLVAVLDDVQACGIGWIRVDFDWYEIEPSQNSFNWTAQDAIVAAAASRGLVVFGTLAHTPPWAGGGTIQSAPNNAADWYDFCYQAALRYDGNHGKGLVTHWGMWNEPNLNEFWTGTRQQYIDTILKTGSDAVHAANPNAKVCAPDLSHTAEWYYWLKESIEQAGGGIDIVTHHIYKDNHTEINRRLENNTTFGKYPDLWGVVQPSVKEVVEYVGWFGRPFWLAETGWQSGQVGEIAQATYYGALLNDWFTGQASRSWMQRIFFYRHFDAPLSESTFGICLLASDHTVSYRKRAWYDYRDFIAAHPPQPSPCADPPSNPGYSHATSGSIQWIWNDNSDNETGFKVYADPGSGPPTTHRGTTGPNVTYWEYTALTPNVQYCFQVAATNPYGDSERTPNYKRYTLANAPLVGYNVVCNKAAGSVYPAGTTFAFSNPAGFGTSTHGGSQYKVSYFKFVWDKNPTHVWTDSESYWLGGSLALSPSAGNGAYYLHLRSYNGDGIGGPTTLDFGPFHYDGTRPVTVANPAGGEYCSSVAVTLIADEAAAIYYTTDGSEPTTGSSVYEAPVQVTTDTILRFYAVDAAGNAESPKKVESYAILYSIDGAIALEDYQGEITQVPVTVELRKRGGDTTTRTIYLGPDGRFTLSCVEPGTYDLAFKAAHWLRKVVVGVRVGSSSE